MAHFAEISEDGTVLRVIVISNDDIKDDSGNEIEELGKNICIKVAGNGNWVQTSYNGNFRKTYGHVGFKYVQDKDVFYNPEPPFPSWSLNQDYDWTAPVPCPGNFEDYYWDEEILAWQPVNPKSVGDTTVAIIE